MFFLGEIKTEIGKLNKIEYRGILLVDMPSAHYVKLIMLGNEITI